MLADLPVLFTPLLSACYDRRVTEERRNTVTGQSAKQRRERRPGGEREKSEALVAWNSRQQEEAERGEETERRNIEQLQGLNKAFRGDETVCVDVCLMILKND